MGLAILSILIGLGDLFAEPPILIYKKPVALIVFVMGLFGFNVSILILASKLFVGIYLTELSAGVWSSFLATAAFLVMYPLNLRLASAK